MRTRRLSLLPLALLFTWLVLGACSQRESSGVRTGRHDALAVAGVDSAREAFGTVFEVLQHPRCLNCHPDGDRPLQHADARPHAMNVVRGADDRGAPGMRCDGCHGKGNLALENLPPGVSSGWRLAPRAMVFEGLSPRELAEMLTDPERSHMSPEEMLEHVDHDPLVQWGWSPGPGREPVPVPHAEFVAAFRTWIEGGMPAPAQ